MCEVIFISHDHFDVKIGGIFYEGSFSVEITSEYYRPATYLQPEEDNVEFDITVSDISSFDEDGEEVEEEVSGAIRHIIMDHINEEVGGNIEDYR